MNPITPETLDTLETKTRSHISARGEDVAYPEAEIILSLITEVRRLQEQVNRRCECGELVSCPENVHCGACA